MNTASFSDRITVEHSTCEDREFLKFPISGWDEVKKLTKKVLVFDGREFIFSCWNSDHNYCVFYRMLDGSEPLTAEWKKRK